MSIAAVCVDRARLLQLETSAVRVEGSTCFIPVPGQWFRCRLFLTQSTDAVDTGQGHFSSVSSPQVLSVVKDLDGNLLTFRGDEHMEINSPQFGRKLWRMTGEPEPLRKRRPIIGWLSTVERVIERRFDDLLNQDIPDIYSPLGNLASPTPMLSEEADAGSGASVSLFS